MRLRNVKNKEDIMNGSSYCIRNPEAYSGKWSEYFGNHNPIYVEIGMGKGQFVIENAKLHPEINFIGIEKYDSVVAKGLQKIPEGLTNLVMVRGDALYIDEFFSHEISKIYLNFSDPWPKKRHQLRRLSSPVFLKKYETCFVGEKKIEMRTDNRELFEYSLVSFSEGGYLLSEVSLDFHHESLPEVTTEYEDKFSKKGMPIYYVSVQKDCL